MISIDGTRGEGGGQILRTALSLSMITGRAVCLERVRAKRKKPGLKLQHLTAVQAAAEICAAEVEGAELGSQALTFRPGETSSGDYRFAVGSAGSACLVLQTILVPLLVVAGPSRLTLEGGTHNPMAPSYDFLCRAFFPILQRMGAGIDGKLERAGFYPRGGGRITLEVEPPPRLEPVELIHGGEVLGRHARVLIAGLPSHIAQRELEVVRARLGWSGSELEVDRLPKDQGPGNAVVLEVEREEVTEVFSGFGRRGVRAEEVATEAVEAARRYLAADVPVGIHLADQLLLPMAIAGGGVFRTLPLTSHATTNLAVIQSFLDVRIEVEDEASTGALVRVGSA